MFTRWHHQTFTWVCKCHLVWKYICSSLQFLTNYVEVIMLLAVMTVVAQQLGMCHYLNSCGRSILVVVGTTVQLV